MLLFSGPGFPGLDPGRGPTHCSSSHAVVASHIEKLEGPTTRIYNYVLGLWEEKKKRKIDNDVSSGPVFLSKAKTETKTTKDILLKKTTKSSSTVWLVLFPWISSWKVLELCELFLFTHGAPWSLRWQKLGNSGIPCWSLFSYWLALWVTADLRLCLNLTKLSWYISMKVCSLCGKCLSYLGYEQWLRFRNTGVLIRMKIWPKGMSSSS